MKKLICFISIFCMLFSFAQSAFAADEYVVRYDDASVSYTGNWTQSTQNCMPNTQGSKMTSNSAGTAIFKLPSGAKAGNYRIYYFLAHTTTTGMTIAVNGVDAGFNASCYGYSAGAVNEYVALGGDRTYSLRGDGTDEVVLTSGSAGHSRATSIKFVYVDSIARETYKVSYDDPSVTYSGTWSVSSSIYGDEGRAGSKTTTAADSAAYFPLPEDASEGMYAIYYFLAHTTSDYAATVGENTYTLSVSDYGYTKSATTVRQWIRIGGEDALFRLKGGEGISFKQRGYTRATSVLFVRMANVPAEGKVNFQRIGLSDSGFLKSDGWTSATMPDSAGNAASLYTNKSGEYVSYTSKNLEEGWYDVSFWNIKYNSNQNPVKMTAKVESGGKTRIVSDLPVNTESENRGGIWSKIGTFYFDGTNDEKVSLITTGGDFARVADMKFEKNENYVPDYITISDKTTEINAVQSKKIDSNGGTFAIYAQGVSNAYLKISNGGDVVNALRIKSGADKTYVGTVTLPGDTFLTMRLSGDYDSGKLIFENVTDKPHANITLTDALMNDTPIYELSAGKIGISAKLSNLSSASCVVLAGLYDGDSLIGSAVSDVKTVENGGAEASLSMNIAKLTQNSVLKVCVWDSFAGMHPLIKPQLFYPYTGTAPYLIFPDDFSSLGSWAKEPYSGSLSGLALAGRSSTQAEAKDATVSIYAETGKTCRLWVRSRNFADSAGQRTFHVAVNNVQSERQFGTTAKDGFCWEDGGLIPLKKGENTLSLIDTSGYYARLDAVLITDDLSLNEPKNNFNALLAENNRVQPIVMEMEEKDRMENFAMDKNFSGGNILLDGKKQDVVYIRPDLSDTSTDWFYWNFKATSDVDRTVTFKLINTGNKSLNLISASGAAYSTDEENWSFISESAYKSEFTYTFKAGQTVHFACTIPYVLSDLESYIEKVKANYKNVKVSALCTSEQGREVPLFTIGNEESGKAIVFTSRHHCCEASPSFLLEGLVDYISEEMPAEILDNYCFYIVPMMDVDGVENGDQGKQRIPHDHNRDYEEKIYNSVRALTDFAADKNVVAFMDYHCPGLADSVPYLYYDSTSDKDEVMLFASYLKAAQTEAGEKNTILYDGSRDYDDKHFKACSKGYFYLEKGAKLSTTFEFPYTGKVGNEYTPDKVRAYGKIVGKAYENYILNELK